MSRRHGPWKRKRIAMGCKETYPVFLVSCVAMRQGTSSETLLFFSFVFAASALLSAKCGIVACGVCCFGLRSCFACLYVFMFAASVMCVVGLVRFGSI